MKCIIYSSWSADHFSECVESHAFETYDKFIKAQGEDLKKMPAPEVAVNYYTGGDLYLSGLVWLSTGGKTGVSHFPCHFPQMNFKLPEFEILEGLRSNLYDVFVNIRDDEAEHCKTMKTCQTHGNLRSPHSRAEDMFEDKDDSACALEADCEGIVDCIRKSVTSNPAKLK